MAAQEPTVHDDWRATPELTVTVGNNVQAGTGIPGFNAGTGWDAVTGLGTPNAAKLVPALAGVV